MSLRFLFLIGFILFFAGCNKPKKDNLNSSKETESIVKNDLCDPLFEKLKNSVTGKDAELQKLLQEDKATCLKKVEELVASSNAKSPEDIQIKKSAAGLLGQIKSVSSIPVLAMAVADKNPQLRAVAVNSLKEYTFEQLEETLKKMLLSEDFKVRISAVNIIEKYKSSKSISILINSLGDTHAGVRNAINNAISILGKPAVDALLNEYKNDKSSIDKRMLIVALGRTKSDAVVETLLNVIESGDVKLKNAAACALSDIKDERTVKPLIDALNDPNPPVRACAAKSLGTQEDKSAAPLLIKLLNSDEYDQVKSMSAYSLGKLKDERAVNVLIGGLKAESRAVRYHCVAALSNYPKANAANALSTVLNDSEIRIHAISSLIKIGDPAVPAMIKSLKSKDQSEAGGAAAVLGRIGNDKAVKPLIEALSRPEDEVKRQANAALRMITKQSFGDDIEAWKNWTKTQK